MTKEEYIKRMNEEDDWAPGWDAIEEEFERLYPGQNPAEIDEWIFDPQRKSGDKIMFEGDTQILILFYVEASPNPEWYDRVNSFIRMDNYQAFVSEKIVNYSYKFHEDGLKYIKDIPS